MPHNTSNHRQPAPPRRRWRGAAIATAAIVALAAGYATANAATAENKEALSTTGVPAVVAAATAFLDTLSDDQQAQALVDFSSANAVAWSDLPCGDSCRPGIELGSLTDEQLTAAEAVLAAAMGTGDGLGFDQASQIRQADDVLAAGGTGQDSDGSGNPTAAPSTSTSAGPTQTASAGPSARVSTSASVSTRAGAAAAEPGGTGSAGPSASGTAEPGGPSGNPSGNPSANPSGNPSGNPSSRPSSSPSSSATSTPSTDSGYGSGFYYLAFLGTPSSTGTWQLHFGGDHLAVNLTYDGGAVTSASPYLIGAEPASFTTDGTTYQPLEGMRAAMAALTGSLTETEVDEAKLDDSLDDVLLGSGEDGEFPDTNEGLAVGDLTASQQQLVLTAIGKWVAVADDASAAQLLEEYEADLDETYIAYSGGVGLDTHGDYVRIDGPGVWIEFLTKTGTVDPEQVIYQSVYRDHTRDYGGEFTF